MGNEKRGQRNVPSFGQCEEHLGTFASIIIHASHSDDGE